VIFGCNKHQPQNPPVDCVDIPPQPGFGTGYQLLGDDTSDYAAAYNPLNSNEIIYIKSISHLHTIKLYKANLNTGDSVLIGDGSNFSSPPELSTTNWIVFCDGNFQICKYMSDGSSFTKLTNSGQNFNPDWSPDGNKIVFKQGSLLYTMHNDGSSMKLLDSSVKGANYPAWSPDGSKIAYSAVLNSSPYIGYMDTITKQKIVLSGLSQGETVSAISWFPMSDMIIWATSSGLYTMNINTMQ